MICDCCDQDRPDVAPYETEDGADAVLLCRPCVQMLTDMTEGTEMAGSYPKSDAGSEDDT